MKKRTIGLIATVTGVALIALLSLQTLYFGEVLEICAEQFDLQAQRAMRKLARELEHEQELLPAWGELSIDERINGAEIDRMLRANLRENGVDIGYHFRVTTSDGREIYRCSDYKPAGIAREYVQELFMNSQRQQMGVLRVYFPDRGKYVLETVHYMVPVVVLTVLVLIMFVITIWAAFRQKRLSEIKNDFVNNMTHELKTPISTISLASQMLGDNSMPKSPDMVAHLSTVISDETRRLRYLVDRVLQMSMFDRYQAATLKLQPLDVNTLIGDVVSTFRLKVENSGGGITAHLDATDPIVEADEMHLTNVVFNLLDNAVKYRDPERPLVLRISTQSDEHHLTIVVEDNGIGLKREDLRKVFDRFYRVSTGNRHDVKGFGLGLAYVRSVVSGHGGTIHAESEIGQGTRFVIKLPMSGK